MDRTRLDRDLVVPVRVDPDGIAGPTRDQARGPSWRRSSRGLYVPARVDGSRPRQRIVEAAATLPSYGGITGWGALAWAGGAWFDGFGWGSSRPRPVVLVTGSACVRSQPGILISTERLNPLDLTTVTGLATTTAVRAVCFEMRYAATLRLAVVALDMAACHDLVSVRELVGYALEHPGWTGIPRCREAMCLADENSWSPMETLMRLLWTLDAGHPRPRCNVPVFDRAGRHLGTPDLLDPVAGVVGEYDGALHLEGDQRLVDLEREDVFRSHGLECVTMVAGDHRDPRAFLGRLHAAYARALEVPDRRRRWTLERPEWWPDTSEVDLRRALSDEQRDRWLRHQAA